MKKRKIAFWLILMMLLSGCGNAESAGTNNAAPTEEPKVIYVTATPTTKVFNMPHVTDTPTPTPTYTPTPTPTRVTTPTPEGSKWVGTWGSAQLTPGDDTKPPAPGLAGNTYRQTVRISISGDVLQFTFSNTFGKTELELDSVHIAKSVNGKDSLIDPATSVVLTFNGSEKAVIPEGETITSDPISFKADALSYISVTTCFGKVPETITSHTASRSLNFLVSGNHVDDAELTQAKTATSWYFLSEVDVFTYDERCAVVCFGDSITDGYGVETGSYGRWTDVLAERLQSDARTENTGVLNSGIGGNSIYGGNGQPGRVRFDRDVLERYGAKYLIIFIGTNDIGYAPNVSAADSVISGLKELVDRGHEAGLTVYLATVTPFYKHSYYTEIHEQVREKVNEWIRSGASGAEAVIDFDALLRDENEPKMMKAEYANDYLHPNMNGYRALGEGVDLELFLR